jgi:hypothetical protein
MCANARQRGFQSYAFKFRSYVLSVSDLLYQALPKARLLFLYRNALTWAQSFSRAFGASDAQLAERVSKLGFRFMIPSVNTFLSTHTQPIRWIEYLAHMWVSTMQDARLLQQQQAPMACARFEDLKAAPHAVIASLLTHCGLPMPNPDQLAAVLSTDSQEGTVGAQDRPQPVRRLADAELAELEHHIRELDRGLSADTIL